MIWSIKRNLKKIFLKLLQEKVCENTLYSDILINNLVKGWWSKVPLHLFNAPARRWLLWIRCTSLTYVALIQIYSRKRPSIKTVNSQLRRAFGFLGKTWPKLTVIINKHWVNATKITIVLGLITRKWKFAWNIGTLITDSAKNKQPKMKKTSIESLKSNWTYFIVWRKATIEGHPVG